MSETEDMVEVVARAAISAYHGEDCWDSLVEEDYDSWLMAARAAIEAMRGKDHRELALFDANGDFCAECEGPAEQVVREIMHYAAMYSQDGPVRIEEIIRLPVDPAALNGETR